MDRRDFIKLTAVTGTSATLASCGHPEHALIRFVPDEDLVPGVATWKPSACPLCGAGCGLVVRVMAGEAEVLRDGERGIVPMSLAKKLEGNPAHPVSQGALCARGQAAIQVTYHPDRLTHPLQRSGDRGSGQYREVTWDAAIAALVTPLDQVAARDARGLAVLTRPDASQRQDLWAQWLAHFGAPPAIPFALFDDAVLRRANLLSFGHAQLPTFDLAQSRVVINFGADVLGTWNAPVAHTAAYGRLRQGRPGIRGTWVQVEPRLSQTGANADEWVPARPGTEGVLALGLAHVLLAAQLRPATAAGHAGTLIEGWAAGLPAYTPAEVERQTGVAAARVARLARALVEQSPAVAIIGGAPLAQTNGLFQALAVNALNALLGAVDAPGGLHFMPQYTAAPAPAARSVRTLAADLLAGPTAPVQALLLDGVNPVYGTPDAWRVREALLRVPFIASFGSFLDETSVLADLILPDHSFLEAWTDHRAESGAAVAVATLAPPVMPPLHQTRATPDVLLAVGRQLQTPVTLPWTTFDAQLQAAFGALAAPPAGADAAWALAQQQGGLWGAPAAASRAAVAAASRAPVAATAAQFAGDAGAYPLYFLPYPSPAFYDGTTAHLPWLQELPDALTSGMWSSWIEINPETAARLQLAAGDVVEIGSAHGTLQAAVVLFPGIAPDVIAMPVGQGHTTFTRYATGRGANPVRILAPVTEPETGALAWAATRVRVTRVGGPDGRLILLAGSQTEHPDLSR